MRTGIWTSPVRGLNSSTRCLRYNIGSSISFCRKSPLSKYKAVIWSLAWQARWTEHSLAGNDQLIALLYTGVGYDHIDVKALTDAGVLFCFAPDAVRRPMACTIITFILALAMKLMAKDKITRQGRWSEQNDYRGEGLTGKTLGSIGVGNIGHEVFVLAQPFGMRHLGCDPYIKQTDVDDVGVQLVDMDTLASGVGLRKYQRTTERRDTTSRWGARVA